MIVYTDPSPLNVAGVLPDLSRERTTQADGAALVYSHPALLRTGTKHGAKVPKPALRPGRAADVGRIGARHRNRLGERNGASQISFSRRELDGGPSRPRTCNRRIMSPLLCH